MFAHDHVLVPNVYPVDLFEHIWVIDRLQRLGISRYFESEIKDCAEYIYRYANTTRIKNVTSTLYTKPPNLRFVEVYLYMKCIILMHNKLKNWNLRYWTKDGICWARNSNVQDIDDTAMAFRVLRMHGYVISPGWF